MCTSSKRSSATISRDKVLRSLPLGQLCSFVLPRAPDGTRDVSFDLDWRGKLERGQKFVFTKFLPPGTPLPPASALSPVRLGPRFSGLTGLTSVENKDLKVCGARTHFSLISITLASTISLCIRDLDLVVL